MKFQPLKDGEWVQPIKRGYRMKCCDCGLVHEMEFRVVSGRVQFRAWRGKKPKRRLKQGKEG